MHCTDVRYTYKSLYARKRYAKVLERVPKQKHLTTAKAFWHNMSPDIVILRKERKNNKKALLITM